MGFWKTKCPNCSNNTKNKSFFILNFIWTTIGAFTGGLFHNKVCKTCGNTFFKP